MTNIIEQTTKLKTALYIKLLVVMVLVWMVACKADKTEHQNIVQVSFSDTTKAKPILTEAKDDGKFKAHKTQSPVQIDGNDKDDIWSKTKWYDMNYIWMGTKVEANDYNGKFKLAWNSKYLYILAEVTDDYLNPTLSDGVDNCLLYTSDAADDPTLV